MNLKEYCKKNDMDITWKNTLLQVLDRKHKKSKIFSITCNINTLWIIAEWCDKNKVKKLLHNKEMEDYEIMITPLKYDETSSFWKMEFETIDDNYIIKLYYNAEKNNYRRRMDLEI